LIFNKLFFPQFDPVAGTIASFAAYAVGFLVRPIGGIVFGWLGDRVGRKPVLLATLILMGLATSLIGLLPTYAQAGICRRSCWWRSVSCRVLAPARNMPARS
jgi:MHS family shikimate/dehydroshikimate transporter-like MFS transporter